MTGQAEDESVGERPSVIGGKGGREAGMWPRARATSHSIPLSFLLPSFLPHSRSFGYALMREREREREGES